MPSGTPPEKLLEASRNFAQEKLAPLHRYALALHADERHPHVHLVVRAANENGVRLNIRKPMLQEWRRRFARHLRALGVAAKATRRTTRRTDRASKLNGIYRPARASMSSTPNG
jgi:type IV secretory pathway VirD2 relaxase